MLEALVEQTSEAAVEEKEEAKVTGKVDPVYHRLHVSCWHALLDVSDKSDAAVVVVCCCFTLQ